MCISYKEEFGEVKMGLEKTNITIYEIEADPSQVLTSDSMKKITDRLNDYVSFDSPTEGDILSISGKLRIDEERSDGYVVGLKFSIEYPASTSEKDINEFGDIITGTKLLQAYPPGSNCKAFGFVKKLWWVRKIQ